MSHQYKLHAFFALLAFAFCPTRAEAQTAYALASDGEIDGSRLIRFDISNPGGSSIVGSISGAFPSLHGLDFRASNGLLYGYNFSSDDIALIDTNTGATANLSSTPTLFSSQLGIDFNPQVDRLRLVTTAGDNRRITVQDGTTNTDPNLTFGGDTPSIIEAAYTNNDNNPLTPTVLYYIDNRTDSLYTTADPNAGVLTLVGALGVDTNRYTGFDIVTYGGINFAYAILSVSNSQPAFYSINLDTGAATFIGALSANTVNVWGLSITPVPEPGSLALVGMAIAGLLAFRRHRVHAV